MKSRLNHQQAEHVRWFVAVVATFGWSALVLRCLATHEQVFRIIQPSIQLWGERLSKGQIPWIDFSAEYPPLGVYTIALPGVFQTHSTPRGWVITQCVVSLMVTLSCLFTLWKAQFNKVGASEFGMWSMTLLLLLGLMKEGWLLWNETLPTVFCLLSALAVFRFRTATATFAAGIVFAVSALSKIYLLLLCPILLLILWEYRREKFRPSILGISTACVSFAIFSILNKGAFDYFLQFHNSRKVEVGSIYAAIVTLSSSDPVATFWHSGSYEIAQTFMMLGVFSAVPCLVGLLTVAKTVVARQADDPAALFEVFSIASFAVMSLFFGMNKIGSPNYLVVPILLSLGFIPGRLLPLSTKLLVVGLILISVLASRGSFSMWTATQDLREVGLGTPVNSLIKNLALIALFGIGWSALRGVQACPKRDNQ